MLTKKTYAADVVLTAPADFNTNQAANGEFLLGFEVEEEEMLVDLEARVAYSASAAADVTLTLYVDGAASPDLPAAGLWLESVPLAAAGLARTAYLRAPALRLARGAHKVELRAAASAGDVTLHGASLPVELFVRRHSHPATLGHGVDSKVQLIQ